MKKKFLYLFLSSTFLYGGVKLSAKPVPLTVGIDDPTGTMPDYPKTPNFIPFIDQNGLVLTFEANHSNFTLQLLDEYGNLEFTTYIPSTLTTVTLPSTLSGEYEILLLPDTGSIYFFGTITL
ncbi:MAG: hypothetical protein J6Z14_07465 [Prevotella sp.]|nr:hypothetical protein [Prevotella sp.]